MAVSRPSPKILILRLDKTNSKENLRIVIKYHQGLSKLVNDLNKSWQVLIMIDIKSQVFSTIAFVKPKYK